MKPLYCTKGHENPSESRFCHICGEQLPQQPIAGGIFSGMILGDRYRIARQIGQGGFGRTYLAEDINRFNERCVLKEFAPLVQGTYAQQKGQELFSREAGVLYKLQHPQIPRFREMFRGNVDGEGRLFLVQDYVDGQNYRTLLANRKVQGKTFSEPEVTQLLLQVLLILEYVHSLGVIHRDISPDNLMLRSSDLLPVLIDFGGVKQVAAEVQSQYGGETAALAPATRLGKMGYAPDEQMQVGSAYPHSDLYALAVTALVLLTGKEPQELRDSHTLSWIWRQHVSLSPSLAAVLETMLSHRPSDRYQSAREVLQAIAGSPSAATFPPTQPAYIPPQPAPMATQATQPVSPPAPPIAPQPPHPAPVAAAPAPISSRSSPALNILLIFAVIAGMGVGGWWFGNYWVDRQRSGENTAIVEDSEPPPSDQIPAAEQQRKEALRDRRRSLGVDYNFYVKLVDAAFYAQYPERQSPLTNEPADAEWRDRWDRLADNLLSRLDAISPEARTRLGRYSLADIDRRKAEVNKLHLSSRALNDLADAKFFYLFPEQSRGENLLDKPIGQVWQAIATEQVQAVQNGTALEEIQFAPGTTSTQLSGTLEPGTGKAYIAKLSKNQLLQLNLNPEGSALLSLYPPTSKTPPLLEDSKVLTWTGKLSESGYYEVVVVSEDSQPISYQLNFAADR